MDKQFEQQAKVEMDGSLESLAKDFSKVRTGRASISLLDSVRVDYYGTPTPLNQLATLAIPEPRMITIQPWEVSVVVLPNTETDILSFVLAEETGPATIDRTQHSIAIEVVKETCFEVKLD